MALETSNFSAVAKEIDGISKDPLAAALNAAGYRYSNAKPKGWKFAGEGDESLDKSIFDYMKRSSPLKKSYSQQSTEIVTTRDVHAVHRG